MDVDVAVLQGNDAELVAHIFLRKIACLDDSFAHVHTCFGRTFWPSFKSAGGLTIRSSPPIRPLSTCTPSAVVPATFTCFRTACSSTITNTVLSRIAEEGTTTSACDGAAVFPEVSFARNATLAFISGRR